MTALRNLETRPWVQVDDLNMHDLASPCAELYDCIAKGAPAGSAARTCPLITAAIEGSPLGNDSACLMRFDVWPIKLLFTAHLLAYFLLFFIQPIDPDTVNEDLLVAIDLGMRSLNQKMMEGIRDLVVQRLGGLPMTLELFIHRLEIL